MTLKDIKELLDAEVVCGEKHLDIEIKFAGGSDMMSDVLAFGQPGLLLLTGLSNSQSVRTADIIEASAIIYVRGKRPDDVGVNLAKDKDIPLLTTHHTMYTACGILYNKGLPGVIIN
jgi:predicted transcriptional regulator